MSLLSRLFSGRSAPQPDAEPKIYKDFRIFPQPVKEGGGFRVAARIEKEIAGAVRSHRMVRADTCDSEDLARDVSTRKAKAVIDQQGEAILDD